ncbi:MAG: hypothetical protein P9X22_08495 [Candidatus Zapsychrus exili]|nr:hypothetical protein [Candidatus Zapsychrus exili]
MKNNKILIASPDKTVLETIKFILSGDYDLILVNSKEGADAALKNDTTIKVIVVDNKLQDKDDLELPEGVSSLYIAANKSEGNAPKHNKKTV